VLVGINGGSPLLLENHAGPWNHWVGIRLRGVKANRDGVGATITRQPGGAKRSRLKTAGGSCLSAHDPRGILGLGAAGPRFPPGELVRPEIAPSPAARP
jgi:enediyne biosynthesis protein E4